MFPPDLALPALPAAKNSAILVSSFLVHPATFSTSYFSSDFPGQRKVLCVMTSKPALHLLPDDLCLVYSHCKSVVSALIL